MAKPAKLKIFEFLKENKGNRYTPDQLVVVVECKVDHVSNVCMHLFNDGFLHRKSVRCGGRGRTFEYWVDETEDAPDVKQYDMPRNVAEYIKSHPGCITSQIAEALKIEKPYAINICNRLVKRGKVESVKVSEGGKTYRKLTWLKKAYKRDDDENELENSSPMKTGGFVKEVSPGHRRYMLTRYRRNQNDGIGNKVAASGVGSSFECQINIPKSR